MSKKIRTDTNTKTKIIVYESEDNPLEIKIGKRKKIKVKNISNNVFSVYGEWDTSIITENFKKKLDISVTKPNGIITGTFSLKPKEARNLKLENFMCLIQNISKQKVSLSKERMEN